MLVAVAQHRSVCQVWPVLLCYPACYSVTVVGAERTGRNGRDGTDGTKQVGVPPKPLDDLMTDAASVMQTAIDTSHALSRQADGKGSESITSKHRVHAICRKRHPGVCKPRLIRVLSAAYATAVRCYCRFGCVAFKLSFITKLPRGGRY